jgi:enoyl-CoA hydratase/carnithine racemase
MLAFPCITIAALNGHAFAAGAMFSLAHDYRVMRSDRGYFCLPEVDIGMTFTPAMESLILARLPNVTAQEAMTTGRRYTSAEALEARIVHKSVPEAEVLPAALALAQNLAKPDRKTLKGIKQSLYKETLAIIAAEG